MLLANKKRIAAILAILLLLILMVPAKPAGAFVNGSKTIRIGLYYKNGSKDNTLETVMLSSVGGIEIGVNQFGNYTKILDTPYIVNAYVDGLVSSYHIRLGAATEDINKLYTDLNTYKSMGLEAFPVYLNTNLWQIWEGCYLSQGDAEGSINSKIIPKLGAGNYQVALPSSSRIIIKFANGLPCIASESPTGFLMIKSAFNGDPKTVTVNGDRYRTSIELRKTPDAQITVINELSLADYLGGVVPLEIGTTGTPFEALKAQAVAARTYAVANHKHREYGFDLCNTTCCQVYGGYDVENLATNNAVKATEAMVVTYGGNLASLYYFASSGGATANSENVWTKAVPYLQSVDDPYEETKYWSRSFSSLELTNHLIKMGRDIGNVTDFDVIERSESGRVVELRIIGNRGTTVFSKSSTRSAFPSYLPSQVFSIGGGSGHTVKGAGNVMESIDIKGALVRTGTSVKTITQSTTVFVKSADGTIQSVNVGGSSTDGFVITGAGAGHGVGMSQRGAMGMASAGFTYDEILKHYFTGVAVEKANLY